MEPKSSVDASAPGAAPLEGRRFVIDGTNVLLLHGRNNPELRYVLALHSYLQKQGATIAVFFDANTPYLLKDYAQEQLECFEALLVDARWGDDVHLVPSGTEADEWILRRAKAEGADVISNDKYRSRARDNRWIWKRRHALVGYRDRLALEGLGVEIPVRASAADYL